jgi:hypothetical protein
VDDCDASRLTSPCRTAKLREYSTALQRSNTCYPQQLDLEETLDWRAKIVDAYKASACDAPPTRPSFCDGASPGEIARMEQTLACRMPMSLRSLLSQSDGVTEELEIEHNHWLVASVVIYSVDEMTDTNLFMRREYRDQKKMIGTGSFPQQERTEFNSLCLQSSQIGRMQAFSLGILTVLQTNTWLTVYSLSSSAGAPV